MAVEIKSVHSKSDLRKFIHLPASIHKNHANWMPPIYIDEWSFFDSKKNKAFSYSDTIILLAYFDGVLAGRIMGIINKKYNNLHQEAVARFGFFECINNPDVSHSLITSIESWAKERGMSKIIGPYGFSDKDPQGLMIEGFEYPPVIAAPCNEPYLVDLVMLEGYKKEVDCLMFQYDINKPLPETYRRIEQRCHKNTEYRVLELTTKRALKPYILPILKMVNETYEQIYGFVPLDEQEMKELARRYLPLINPRFVKIVLHHGEVVAFIIGLPSLTKGIQRSRGYLFPLGIFHILWASRATRRLDLMLGGVKPEYRGRGLEICMGVKLINSALEANFNAFEIHLILETNTRMIAEMNKAGAQPHKRFRVFYKNI
ncbi:MAG: hypothetical protein AB9842_11640 [Bacteroidales bacterium]